MKKKKKKGLIIAAVLVAVVVLVVVVWPKDVTSAMLQISTETLAKNDLRSTVSATGVVESNTASNVYSKLATAAVDSINVEVGDKVNEGDVLALFDTQSIEDQIAQQKASMSDSAAKAKLSLEQSQKQYSQQLRDFQNDKNANLLNAEKSVNTAKDAVKEAQYAVDNFGDDATSLTADERLGSSSATKDLYNYARLLNSYNASLDQVANAQKELDAAKKSGNADQITLAQEKLDMLNKELVLAKNDYDNAKTSYYQAHHQYEQAQTALKQAKDSYDLAMKSYEIAFQGSLQSIDSAADDVAGSKLSASQKVAQLTLETMEKQLTDATVKAPVSGTITAVYAKEGAASTGLMFVIENTDSLKIVTSIKEFDLASVQVGQKAEIKSDATGETVMEGTVTRIAPTAMKAADGSTKSGTVEFETEISVDGPHDGLKIGMNARVNIVTAEKTSVYSVPFDAVMTDEAGETYIFVAVAGENNTYTAKKVPVTLGLETDFYLEISSSELTDGTIVITNPTGIVEGAVVPIAAPPAGV